MSQLNGDKARQNRQAKQRAKLRIRVRQLRSTLSAKTSSPKKK